MKATCPQPSPARLGLRRLEFTSDLVSEEAVVASLLLCPLASSLVVRLPSPPSPLLADLLATSSITSLDVGNSKSSIDTLHFEASPSSPPEN